MKKKDLKLELYVAQTQILELQKQIENLNDQTPLINHLFDKLRELKQEPPKCLMDSIDLERVAAAI